MILCLSTITFKSLPTLIEIKRDIKNIHDFTLEILEVL